MKIYKKAFAFLVMAVFIAPNLYVFYTGHESFPFTHAPMFGHYIGEDTQFYDFEFVGDDQKRWYPSYREPLPGKDRVIRRFFFNRVYGSMEPSSFSYYPADSKEAFVQRLEKFFPAYFRYLHADSATVGKIHLEVWRYDARYAPVEKHTVGYYDVPARKFYFTWKNNP